MMKRLASIAATALALTTGCYAVEPASTTPVPGRRVQMAITDEGRLALGGTMGPEIRRVEGNLLSKQENEYVVSVTGVNYVNGIFQAWKGETVRINTSMVSGLYEKRFSPGRTILFAAGAAAAAYVLAPKKIKTSLPEEGTPPPIVQSSIRPIVQFRLPFAR